MEQSGKRSPQSEFWNIREKERGNGKKVVTHSKNRLDVAADGFIPVRPANNDNLRLINPCSGCAFDSAVAGLWQVCRLANRMWGRR